MSDYQRHHVYCADVGAVETSKKENNFGWAGASVCPNEQQTSWLVQESSWRYNQEIQDLANDVADKLKEGDKVALGFECPLWIPVRGCPKRLTKGRCGDGSRSWSAGAGPTVLATGLAEVPWVLQEIRGKLREPYPKVFLNWDSYQKSKRGLFIWEAFVSGNATATPNKEDASATLVPHTADARAAVRAFIAALPSPQTSVHPCSQTRSLIGEALLWSRWSKDLCLLRKHCIVIKLNKPTT